MRFRFDANKAASNFKKHRVSFADTEAVFEDPLAIHFPDPDAEGEERLLAVGLGSAAELLVVCYTVRSDEIRLISARRATRNERKQYEG